MYALLNNYSIMFHCNITYFCISIIIMIDLIICSHVNNCSKDHFILKGMSSCNPLLTCDEIKNLTLIRKLNDEGNVKDIFLSKWKEYYVVLLKPKNLDYIEDFENGLNILKLLNGDNHIIKLVGYCDKLNIYVTEYQKNGDGRNILKLLSSNSTNDTIYKRVELCLNYVEILNYLHNSPIGQLVFCDSNDIVKLLSQLLIDNDFKLIMNDLDALPVIKSNETILCGCRQLTGNFIAPEQRETDHNCSNDYRTSGKGYNEKVDIWKVPDVCNYIIKSHEQYKVVIYYLFNIHKQCKNINFDQRPSAQELVDEYKYILRQLLTHDDL
ncbi:protein O-mannose kinase-like [Lycorma delicatula]|uniref:protein O-mannose kinase-like n=1 Tax=Lycorma delicatula TaxID=130591 RepID=UPI003F513BB7